MRRTAVIVVLTGVTVASLAGCGGGSNSAAGTSTAFSSTTVPSHSSAAVEATVASLDALTGSALMRVAGALPPSKAAQYETAVKAMS